jgi:tetratricopeptide (TPR) repeat protein
LDQQDPGKSGQQRRTTLSDSDLRKLAAIQTGAQNKLSASQQMRAPAAEDLGRKSNMKLIANMAMTFLIPVVLLGAIGLFMKNMFEKTALEQHVNLGQEFYKKGKYQQAAREFEKAVNQGANTSEIYGLKGSSELKLGNFDKASASYKEASNRDPSNLSYVLGEAEANLKLGNVKAAAENASEILQKDANNLEAMSIRAAAASKSGEFDQAITYVNNYAKKQKPSAELIAHRADAYFRTGKNQNALADYNSCISSDPKITDYYAGKAAVLKEMRQYKAAADACTSGLKLASRDVGLLDLRSKCLILTNDKAGAARDIERIAELDPTIHTLKTSAEALQSLGRSDLAFHYLNKVLEQDPKDAAAAQKRDELSKVLKSKQIQAESQVAVVESPEPSLDEATLKALSVDQLIAKGRAAYSAGSPDAAVAILSMAVRKAPSSGEARRMLAHALIGGGNLSAGAREFANLQTISASGRDELLQFGAKFKAGAPQVAISIYEKLLKHDKADVDARLGLIECYTGLGEKAKVVEIAKEGVTIATSAQVKQLFQAQADAASK